MFETATWTLRNRRNFAIVEELYRQLDLPLTIADDWDLRDERQMAAALVHNVGAILLYGSVRDTAARPGKPGKVSKRQERATWKSINDAGAGVHASVFLTVGAAAMLTPEVEEEVDPVPIEYARLSVIDAFEFPESEVAYVERVRKRLVRRLNEPLIKEADARGGTAVQSAKNTAQAILGFEGLKIARVDPATTPMYGPVAELDQKAWDDVASLDWALFKDIGPFAISWKHAKERFLEIAFEPFA